MSGPVMNEASKEVASSTSSAWITDAFDCYQVPLEMGQDTIDPLAEHIRYKCQVRHLGPAYLKCGYFSAIQVHFYEVTRSEISELAKVKRHSLCFSSGVGRHDAHLDTHDNNGGGGTLRKNVEALPHFFETTQPLSPGPNSSTAGGVLSSLGLPPKKRKKRTVIQRCVVFSVTKDHHDQQDLSSLSPDCTYYLFPPNSLMDVVNDMAPFQIFCTIHLTKLPSILQSTWTSYKKDRIKLEDLAATCTSGDRLVSIGPHDQVPKHLVDSHSSAFENQSINVEISGASGDVCYPLLESVSEYQTTCQKLADLLQHHNQRATTYKAKFSLNPDRFLPYEQQSISSTTQYPHEKTNITTIKSQDQRQTSLDSDVEQSLQEDSATSEKWQYNKKKLPTDGPDNKIEHTGNDHIPLLAKKKKIKRNQSNRGKVSSTCIRKCIYCNATSTPMWRRGPDGAGTLCNACGVKWKHGKILSGNETSLQTDGSTNTDLKELNTTTNKRKKSKTWIKKEKKVKTTTATSELDMLTNDTSTIVGDHLIMEDQTGVSSINLQLYETTYGHCESTTANDIHHQSSTPTNHDNKDRSNSSSSTTPKLSASLTGMTMAKGDTSTFSTLSSQQVTILSSESIYNSPLTSFTSTPNSSPPMSTDSQQHRGFLALSFADKLDLEGTDDTLPLVAGADDVEAAAVLTLLRQS